MAANIVILSALLNVLKTCRNLKNIWKTHQELSIFLQSIRRKLLNMRIKTGDFWTGSWHQKIKEQCQLCQTRVIAGTSTRNLKDCQKNLCRTLINPNNSKVIDFILG